jgi:predicted phage terminase large subunit-like protein
MTSSASPTSLVEWLQTDPKGLKAAAEAELARRSLLGFTFHTFPGYEAGWVHREICSKFDAFLADVQAKRSPRMMLFVPPRHGKSELISRRGPAYALGRMPDSSFIACSYGAELASRMNRDVQRIIDSDRYRAAFPGTALYGKQVRSTAQGSYLRNSEAFEVVGRKGGYRSAGVGGGITGMGADVLVIDDPIKDAEQANSATYRDKVWDWYTSTAYTRLMPGGGVLIVLTRWHEDDLAGRLLEAAKHEGDRWEVISYPAVAERDEAHRKEGEALHPERYGLDRLKAIRGAVGSYVWAALYQQRPAPADGNKFKRPWFRYYDRDEAAPDLLRLEGRDGAPEKVVRLADCRLFATVDLAVSTRQTADWTVFGIWAATPASDLILLDLVRDRLQEPDVVKMAVGLHRRWNLGHLAVEANGIGLGIVQTMRREGLPVRAVLTHRDKVTNASTAMVRMEAGQIYTPRYAPWLDAYEAELLGFPNAAHDDQVDVTSNAAIDVFWGGGSAEPDAARQAREQAEADAAERERAERIAAVQADPDHEHWWGNDD